MLETLETKSVSKTNVIIQDSALSITLMFCKKKIMTLHLNKTSHIHSLMGESHKHKLSLFLTKYYSFV